MPQRFPRTMFETPVLSALLRTIALAYLRVAGWQVTGALPPEASRCVMIAAPHTSNWDLPYTLMVAFALRLQIHWMGKHTIFRPPFRAIMQWLGGIAVDRNTSNNLVAASAEALRTAQQPMQLIVPPEGTRSRSRYWKTGFYHIALSANVPIVLAYMDYERKLSGLGPVFYPTGDLEADMQVIKRFYAQFRGRNADQFEA